jgi:hypothetical protein
MLCQHDCVAIAAERGGKAQVGRAAAQAEAHGQGERAEDHGDIEHAIGQFVGDVGP